MKRKEYVKPSMEVFELQQQQQLLAGSVNATGNLDDPDDYLLEDDPFNF